MVYFALHYEVVPGFRERRLEFRDAHLRMVRGAHERGELLMAGALGDPPDGALLVFRGDSAAAVEDFARADPVRARGPGYIVAGAPVDGSCRFGRRAAESALMIERVWSGRTTRDGAVKYADHFRRVVVPELAALGGYRGARLLERELDGGIEVVVVTRWHSLDAIRAFAGDELDRAVVHPDAAALFSDFDRKVRHFGVVTDAGDV